MNVTSDVHLERDTLKGRTFLLGNKRAFSLSLPASPGGSDSLLHAHKWFGAYLYGRKFIEGHLVRAVGQRTYLLGPAHQTGFTMTLTSACREFQVEGRACREEYFVPDGVQGFTCSLYGDVQFEVEPEFDLRFYRALNDSCDGYEVEVMERGAIVSHALPAGTYDDSTETFIADDSGHEAPGRLYAAVEIVARDARCDLLSPRLRSRRKVFRKDEHRLRFLEVSAPAEARHDHAPLWNQATSHVFAPVRLRCSGEGKVIYGFGASRDEALHNLAALRENAVAFEAQKAEGAREIVDHARFETGVSRLDRAYVHVLSRMMDALVARHAIAADTALERPATMILAGNQYFHDSWKRDENIALGFLLKLGFHDLARDVIHDTWQLQDPVTGRLPQRIRAGEEPPYHSSDGTLWALWRLHQYWRATGDDSLLLDKLSMVCTFFARSMDRSVDGMLPSGRTHAPDYLWETWMDTPHTPRDGFPVEIQMLWIACLRVFRPIIRPHDPPLERRMEVAEHHAWAALERFYVDGVPADGLDVEGAVRDFTTPNPYFCFGIGLDLGADVEQAMRSVGRRQLAGQQGIMTLAPRDWERVFSPDFLGNRRHVRGRRMRSIGKFNYHRGVEWNWLSQFFVQAELKYADADAAYRTYLRPQVDASLDQAGIGGISELFDLSGTRGPEFQAWSMAGFLEAVHAFAGVTVDVPERRITIEPQVPAAWPGLRVRKWFGSVPFDLLYAANGGTLSLTVEFPWGEAPDVTLEVGLILPAHRALDVVDVQLDGIRQVVPVHLEPVNGTDRARARFTLAASGRVQVVAGLKRAIARIAVSA